MAERSLVSRPVAHVEIIRLGSTEYQNANFLYAMMPVSTSSTPYIAVDFFLQPQPSTALRSNPSILDTVKHHMVLLENIVTRVSSVVLILVCPLASPNFDVHASGLINTLTYPVYTVR